MRAPVSSIALSTVKKVMCLDNFGAYFVGREKIDVLVGMSCKRL